MYMYIDERKRSVGVYIYTQIQVGVKMTISIVRFRESKDSLCNYANNLEIWHRLIETGGRLLSIY